MNLRPRRSYRQSGVLIVTQALLSLPRRFLSSLRRSYRHPGVPIVTQEFLSSFRRSYHHSSILIITQAFLPSHRRSYRHSGILIITQALLSSPRRSYRHSGILIITQPFLSSPRPTSKSIILTLNSGGNVLSLTVACVHSPQVDKNDLTSNNPYLRFPRVLESGERV